MPKPIYAPMDGNEAAAHVAYQFSEIAAIYPITPSSPMAEHTDEWSAQGRKNLFGQTVRLVEMQSEAGAIGAVHGACEAGSLGVSFTSAQGLMLMIPVMYRIAGSRLPAVLHVASRTVGTHAMSIFGDHSDVMACRATGWAMLSSGSVQEVMDLAAVAHVTAVSSRIPFMHFFDGFRTSHEIQKIQVLQPEDLEPLLDREALAAFRASALNPDHPTLRNTVQNPDVYFQIREANNPAYDALPEQVEAVLAKITALTGREYHLFNYYGDPEAERVIVAMGSVSGTIQDTVDLLRSRGEKVGYLQVHLYRPFASDFFRKALPETVRKIAVLDRCKESGAPGEPLYLDVCQAFLGREKAPRIIGGRYGLSSKDVDPGQILAVYDELKRAEPKNGFTIGINDDVTGLSLPIPEQPDTDKPGTVSCKFWGLGSDGTVGANKNSIKIIGDHTELYAQGYFEYDTKKSFGITRSHLRFGPSPIRGTHLVRHADFVGCHNPAFLYHFDMVDELKPGGVFLLNCPWKDEELSEKLPDRVKRYIARNKIALYTIDADTIARDLGLGNHANTVLQAAFFRLAGILPAPEAVEYMKDAARKSYGSKGEKVVLKNLNAIDAGAEAAHRAEVPENWADCPDTPLEPRNENEPDFIKNILRPLNALKGDDLPVSAFKGLEDGVLPLGTTAWEKRGFCDRAPIWDPAKCRQCNLCSLVCSHAVLRPLLLTEAEAKSAPQGFYTAKAMGKQGEGLLYSLQVSAPDCSGCGSCESVCPAKAIHMVPTEESGYSREAWDYGLSLSDKGDVYDPATVKGSQFRQPLLEFSGACAGCGETPYAKLLTQLFGDRVYWANATGCSQAWGAAMPSVPYCRNRKGHGVAWSNSLFEDNAEFALGMALSSRQQRSRAKALAEKRLKTADGELKTALEDWLAGFDSAEGTRDRAEALEKACKDDPELWALRDQFAKKTVWMYGGDGWAYDIGFGGLDHVFSTEEDVNVFVIDTEVYSNTGGQSSKATPMGAVAQFQSSGKKSPKKDLGAMLRQYPNVYVAQVAMGANPAQLVKALLEADAHPGPSIVIGYTPCTAHGIHTGMCSAQAEMKKAVQAGYWHLYRYDPRKEKPFQLDSSAPKLPLRDFLDGEVRYSSLALRYPENADALFAQAEEQAKEKYDRYRRMDEQE